MPDFLDAVVELGFADGDGVLRQIGDARESVSLSLVEGCCLIFEFGDLLLDCRYKASLKFNVCPDFSSLTNFYRELVTLSLQALKLCDRSPSQFIILREAAKKDSRINAARRKPFANFVQIRAHISKIKHLYNSTLPGKVDALPGRWPLHWEGCERR